MNLYPISVFAFTAPIIINAMPFYIWRQCHCMVIISWQFYYMAAMSIIISINKLRKYFLGQKRHVNRTVGIIYTLTECLIGQKFETVELFDYERFWIRVLIQAYIQTILGTYWEICEFLDASISTRVQFVFICQVSFPLGFSYLLSQLGLVLPTRQRKPDKS